MLHFWENINASVSGCFCLFWAVFLSSFASKSKVKNRTKKITKTVCEDHNVLWVCLPVKLYTLSSCLAGLESD